MRNGRSCSILYQALLVQDTCAHEQMKFLSAARLRVASQVRNAVGFLPVPSLRQAQRENGHVQENLQLLKRSLTFLAHDPFSSYTSNNECWGRGIVVYYHKEAGCRSAAPERSFLVSE
jgi:hypothetical protein